MKLLGNQLSGLNNIRGNLNIHEQGCVLEKKCKDDEYVALVASMVTHFER